MSQIFLAGKLVNVATFAAKVIKGNSKPGIYRQGNGFINTLEKFYDHGAVLTTARKKLKDGRTIVQQRWSWPEGEVAALTERSDGFLSSVFKNKDGEITYRMISKNNEHLVQEGSFFRRIEGKLKTLFYKTSVEKNQITKNFDGEVSVKESKLLADHIVSDVRKTAVREFRTIG